ncbi:MAG TPA: glycosyltransferase family 1 protein [Intrasporangium sp.]|uniref:glycosyltransferase family 4 protein n=1 Tax=Intrasporangium sp. TaxID=1925024 RepID=UPI002F95E809
MRVAINLLTDDPDQPSGAHWFWKQTISEMVPLLAEGEELHLVVSPRIRREHSGYGPNIRYITFPWSNERRVLRTLTEQAYAPLRLPRSRIDVFNTLIAPMIKPAPGLVAHFKTLHAFTNPGALNPMVRLYRRTGYPHTAKVADAIIINSESLRQEVETYLDVDPAKLRLIPEAVDHQVFRPGDPEEASVRLQRERGIEGPFVLFVSSLWAYKNCDGLLRAFAIARRDLPEHRLVVVGSAADAGYSAELHALAAELGIEDHVVWVGGIPHHETLPFYRAAAAFVYPSHNETFGLPILEAMACGCPVVTSDRSAMPETAGGAAVLADPEDPASIAAAIVSACGDHGAKLGELGPTRAAQFTWAATAKSTLEVYREVHAAQGDRR